MMKLDFEIDLKPYEQIDPLMKDQILKKGEIIYVRKKNNILTLIAEIRKELDKLDQLIEKLSLKQHLDFRK